MDSGDGPAAIRRGRLGSVWPCGAEIQGRARPARCCQVSPLSGRCQGPGLQRDRSHFLKLDYISTSKSRVSQTEFSCRPGHHRHRWEKRIAYSPLPQQESLRLPLWLAGGFMSGSTQGENVSTGKPGNTWCPRGCPAWLWARRQMGSSWSSGSPPVGSSQAPASSGNASFGHASSGHASSGHASSGAGFLRTMQISVATR